MLMPINKEVGKGKQGWAHLMHSGLLSYAFRIVEYATYEDMRCAMRKLDGTELNGRKLRLIEDYRGHRKRFATEHTCVQ